IDLSSAQKFADRQRRSRASEVKALGHVALHVAKLVELLGSLDAFGDRREPKGVSEADHRSDYRNVLGAVAVGVAEAGNEGTIHLEAVHREALEGAQRRITSAEVVDAELGPERLQCLERRERERDVLHHDRLGYLEAEVGGVRAGLGESLLDPRDEVRILVLTG